TLIFFALGIAAVVAAILYTVGTNAYGYIGLVDVYVFVFFGLMSVVGGYVFYAKQIDHVVFLPACTVGLLSAAVLNLNNMRDIVSDEKSNKITLAVKLGFRKAKKYHLFLLSAAIILSFLFGLLYFTSFYNLIFFIAYVPLIRHLIKVYKNENPKLLDGELKKLALSTFFLAVLMAIGHLL